MSNIVPISSQVPTALQRQSIDDFLHDLDNGLTGGFGVVSFRGARWRIKYQGEENMLTNADGDPKGSIEVVIVKASKQLSKLYYAKAYEEGDDEPPTCMSLDSIKPDPSSPKKQAESCAVCPHNEWGSKITPAGKKSRACGDNRRLAVVPAEDMKSETYGGPLLLRVPGASLGALADFGKKVGAKGYPYNSFVVKISFDSEASFPKLVFTPVRLLKEEEGEVIAEHLQHVDKILSSTADLKAEPKSNVETPAPQVKPKAESKAEPKAPPDELELLSSLEIPEQEAKEVLDVKAEPPAKAEKGKGKQKKTSVAPADDNGDNDLEDLLSILDNA